MSIASLLPANIGLKALAGCQCSCSDATQCLSLIKTVSEQAIGNIIGAILAVTMVTILVITSS